MRNINLLAFVFFTGCFNDTSDLQLYVNNVKANVEHDIVTVSTIADFDHFKYAADSLKSPFDTLKTKTLLEKTPLIAQCLIPVLHRKKQVLEKFSLDSLVMRGTLGNADMTWALIEASNKVLYRITVNNYVGFNHGRVTKINPEYIKIVELIPNDLGCWLEREKTILLTKKSSGT